jgi:hypothetical protein
MKMAFCGQRSTSIALGLIILWSLLILRELVSAQGTDVDPLTDSRLSDNSTTSDCPCSLSEQDINSASSNVSAVRQCLMSRSSM